MRSGSIVVIDEGRQAGHPRGGVMEGAGVGPLAQQGADEAFGLAVGLGPVGTRLAQRHAQALGRGREQPGAIAAAVVTQHALDADAVAGVEGGRPLQEPSRAGRRLVGQLLDIGDARMVVDRHVDPVPADATVLVDRPRSQHAMATAWADATELLGVEVQQLAGCGALVADDRRPRLEPVETSEPVAAQQCIHGRGTQAGLPGQAMRADAQLASQPAQPLAELGRMGACLAPHHAAAIDQPELALAPVAVPPRGSGLAADAGGTRRAAHRPAVGDAFNQDKPAAWGETCLLYTSPSPRDGLLSRMPYS